MFRLGLKSIVIGAVLSVALLGASSEAKAFWGHWAYGGYGWGCGLGCGPACWNGYVAPCAFTSCSPCATLCDPCVGYTPYNSGYWYLGYRPGPLRRLLLGHCRWYWGGDCFGCADACCPTESPCADCAPGCPSCGPGPVIRTTPAPTNAPVLTQPAPVQPAPAPGVPAPAPGVPAPALPDSTYAEPGNSGLLTIWVPSDAKVTVNGMLTKSTGSRRQFVSYGLQPGMSYKYEICAEIIRDGKSVVENRTVILQGGSRSSVAFGFNVKPNEELASR